LLVKGLSVPSSQGVQLGVQLAPKDNTLPKRFFDEPLSKDGKVIRREDLQKMLGDYCALRGWSSEGVPKP
jgi:aldehyde:ferredoxin oxidoreductase